MVIKVWNNHDLGVFRINPTVKKIVSPVRFSPKVRKQLKKAAKMFMEKLGLEFEHNLARGWEKKILIAGRVLDKYGRRELKNIQEIKEELGERGEVQFFSHQEGKSFKFIDSIRKPKEKRWS